MTGLIYLKSGTYIFRDDHAQGDKVWAWEIHSDFNRAKVHKWEQLPDGPVELFDIEKPPQTVSFQPLIADQ